MPRSEPNPQGFQEAVQRSLSERHPFVRQVSSDEVPDEVRSRLQSEFELVAGRIGESSELAASIDEAARSENGDQVIRLLRDAGLSQEVGVTILGVNADTRISVEICFWGWCLRCTCQW
jgi:hypothetical protein